MVVRPEVTSFYDPRTSSLQYVVSDPQSRRCAVIDPVLDYDEKSGGVATRSADAILAHVREAGLTIEWILDTHPHADHLSAAAYLRHRTGGRTGIGERVTGVQKLWKALCGLPDAFPTDGSQWDRLFADADRFTLGGMEVAVMLSPGHTLCSVSYLCGDAAFVHDTLFMPDSGTARTDFPGGSAEQLWDSLQAILALPDATRLFVGHDYRPGGRPLRFQSSIAEQKADNPHLAGQTRDSFIALRQARDRGLAMPKLMLSALQVNIQAGRLPPRQQDGRRYLRIPLGAFPEAVWD